MGRENRWGADDGWQGYGTSLLVSGTWPGPTLAGTQTSVASESLRCRVK